MSKLFLNFFSDVVYKYTVIPKKSYKDIKKFTYVNKKSNFFIFRT